MQRLLSDISDSFSEQPVSEKHDIDMTRQKPFVSKNPDWIFTSEY